MNVINGSHNTWPTYQNVELKATVFFTHKGAFEKKSASLILKNKSANNGAEFVFMGISTES
jgi:hypothetical protein